MKIVITKEKIILAMVKLLIIMTYVLLSGCKTSETNCDAYGHLGQVERDSIMIQVEHCHIEEENYCFYSIDTIRLNK